MSTHPAVAPRTAVLLRTGIHQGMRLRSRRSCSPPHLPARPLAPLHHAPGLEALRGLAILLVRFFHRRLLRILPACFVGLAVYALVPGTHEQSTLAPLWRFLAFTMNLSLEGWTFSHAVQVRPT
ncbi:hypothetical protein BHS05_29815 [Myxococcus xanthus]|nr:hypothetical protein BHS05_29815 [Myxococcus xanthus]